MRFLTVFLTLSSFTIAGAFAQSGYYEDAYRFSRANPSGSARIIGIGGTQYSLGGDVSNIAGNPAGLGFFRTSEISISLGYSDWRVDTRYLGQDKTYNTTNFSLPNASYVMANPKGDLEQGAFKGGGFGISFQRIANFNTEYGYYSDQLGQSSIIDFYLQDAFGIPESQIENYGLTGLAYQTYQINPVAFDENGNAINDPSVYDSFVLGFPFQDENITQQGSANQMTFSYGANFNHKVFVGGGLGIRSLSFSSFKTYNEEFVDQPLVNSSLRENLYINGIGVNLNLGLIYKPIDYVNLGFVFQSPTWYSLNEEYEAGMTAIYNNYYYEEEDVTLGRQDAVTDLVISNYGLNTPLKVGGGATFFLGKNGFISADLDWVDYSAGRISSNDFNEGPDNQVIKSIYASTINYRVGGEARFDALRLRAGYAYFGDPYADSPGIDQSSQQISGGIGVKLRSIAIDFALFNQKYNGLYRSYQVLDENGNNYGPVTEMENSITSGVLTVGFSF
ncbi:long-chain fatty acid transporter [Algoriphagus sp. H41]|uniref:Long-chain fatty acid transporter n=1 Tax=Algoriphagus oliviformis TaxID=2811231 RepID=A0ABS3C5D4_9BACT|nr:long-chain fatty acid transporter [Algoriphagus oliviformis]MBN7812177.1 long-chain fatty acid transporter [Algoriphagus oliviformis]